MKKFYLLFAMLTMVVSGAWADVSYDTPVVINFHSNSDSKFTDKFWGGSVNSIIGTLSDGSSISVTPSVGQLFQVATSGTWANTTALNELNSTLNRSFTAEDFGTGSIHFTEPGTSNATSKLAITFSNYSVGDVVTMYASVASHQTNMANLKVEGLDNAVITYASGASDTGFSTSESWSTGTDVVTIVKIVGNLHTDKIITLSSTSYKNGWQVVAYKVSEYTGDLIHDHAFNIWSNDGKCLDNFTKRTYNTLLNGTTTWTNFSEDITGLCLVNEGGVKFNHNNSVNVTYLKLDKNIGFLHGTTGEKNYINWSTTTSGKGLNIASTTGAWVDVDATYPASNIGFGNMANGAVYLNENGQLGSAGSKLATTNKIYATIGSSFNGLRTLMLGDFSAWTDEIIASNVVLTNNSGKTVKVRATSDGLYVYLAEETRSTAKESYGTICLPYDATATGAVVMEFTGRSANGLVFDFPVGTTEETATVLTAGVPYLYRATSATQTFTTTGTTYTAATPVNNYTGSYTDVDLSKAADNTKDNYFLYTDDNMFHPAGTYVHMGAYRCYFPELPEIDNTLARTANSVVFGIYGDATTGISTLNTSVDLNKDGKFIQNGRMVIVNNGKKYNAAGQIVK